MRSLFTRILVATTATFAVVAMAAGNSDLGEPQHPPRRWYKGNTHTHTVNSDGDSTPSEVVRWYRERDYHFLVLSDHNVLTSVDGLNALYGADEQYSACPQCRPFLVIRGEEVTDAFEDKDIHINGLDVQSLVEPQGGNSVVEVMQRNVDAIRAAAGVPHINHPNFGWSITAADLRQVRDNRLCEVCNGHPPVNNKGGGGRPGLEAMWDAILTSGVLLYGIAVDDAHVFKQPWNRGASRPGQGWIMVRARRLTATDILTAMTAGEFYASTGVSLKDYRVTEQVMEVTIDESPWSKYRTQFIGVGGRILEETTANPAVYEFIGQERYVRAKVLESNGLIAWLQPTMRNPSQ